MFLFSVWNHFFLSYHSKPHERVCPLPSYGPILDTEMPLPGLPGAFSSPGWAAPSLSSCPHSGGVPSLESSLRPFSECALTDSHLSCHKDSPFRMQYSKWGLTSVDQGGRITSLNLLTMLLLMRPRIWLAFWAEGTLLAHVQFAIHKYSQVLFSRAVLNPFILQLVLIVGFATSQLKTLHLDLLNLMRFTWVYCLSLSRYFWMASPPSGMSTAPHRLVSSANLKRVHLIQLSMPLMKILKRTSPSTDPWRTTLITDLHSITEPLTTTLWVQSHNQLLICQTVHSSNPYLSNLERRIWWGLCQRLYWSQDRWHQWIFLCSLMQLCHHRRPLRWSRKTWPWWSHVTYPISAPSLPCAFQENLFHDLPQCRCEADRSVVPWTVLSTLLKSGYDAFFPVIRDFHEFWNIIESGLATMSANSLRTLGWISLGPIDLWLFTFPRCSQTWYLLRGRDHLPQYS